MRVVVLGAGLIGVASAWYLAKDGHDVTVIDRQALPGQETSFANGGQISVSHAEPWANPATPGKILHWLGQEDSPLLWRLRADRAQWAWGWRFLRECSAARSRRNLQALVALGLYSRAQLQILRQELQLEYDQQTHGILHIYTDAKEFEHACRQADVMRREGCERVPVTTEECFAIEPALRQSSLPICGGTYTASDESGDACQFVGQLAKHAAKAGVAFRFCSEIRHLISDWGTVTAVQLANGERLDGDAFVVACGSHSRQLLKEVGVAVPLYPAKGYSVTFDLAEGQQAPFVSLTDDGRKLVFSRLGNRLRVAGTAEFCGYDTTLNSVRCATIVNRAQAFFPELASVPAPQYWTGLRPATPGNVPIIGKTPLNKLWVNTGHGTLGWTLACGSGRLLADILAGRPTALPADSYRAA